MKLAEYFENVKGTGVLGTADSLGNVDLAIYAKPYVIEEDKIAFSMLNRLSYQNVCANPKAAYMFIEKREGYEGKRLYLSMIGEEKDVEAIKKLKKQHGKVYNPADDKHLVYFKVENVRALVGDEGKS